MKEEKRPAIIPFEDIMRPRMREVQGVVSMKKVQSIGIDDTVSLTELVPARRLPQHIDRNKTIRLFDIALMHLSGVDTESIAGSLDLPVAVVYDIRESELFNRVVATMAEEVKNSSYLFLKGLGLSAVRVFAEAMAASNKMSDRLAAAKEVLDRIGLNKVSKHAITEDNSPTDSIKDMTEDERRNLLRLGMEYVLSGDVEGEEDDGTED